MSAIMIKNELKEKYDVDIYVSTVKRLFKILLSATAMSELS